MSVRVPLERLAFVGSDRQLHVVYSDGTGERAVTMPLTGYSFLPIGREQTPAEGYLWPTWSPDGRWLAAIEYPTADEVRGPFHVHAIEVDGVEQIELCQLTGEKPIYVQWSGLGDAVAMLAHGPNHVGLLHCRLDAIGMVNRVEAGVPLFFTWIPDDSRIFVHVGPSPLRRGQVLIKDPLGQRADLKAVSAPGKFCAPVFVGGQAVYAIEGSPEGVSHVVVADEPGRPERILYSGRGLLALVPSPDNVHIAVSAAPGGEHTPYQGLLGISVEDGTSRRFSPENCQAFFWGPAGRLAYYAVVDQDENCIHWREADGSGTFRKLVSFWPTREYMFFLHFFDQFALSHPVVSPTGRYLTYAGFPAGHGHADLSNPPRIFVLDLFEPDSQPVEVAEGSFAVWDPNIQPD
jgi:hypothetical protein